MIEKLKHHVLGFLGCSPISILRVLFHSKDTGLLSERGRELLKDKSKMKLIDAEIGRMRDSGEASSHIKIDGQGYDLVQKSFNRFGK